MVLTMTWRRGVTGSGGIRMIAAEPIAPRHVTLNGVSWAFYQNMLREVRDSHIRLTFDQGRLEIMSPLPIHEQVKKVAARLVEAYADEMDFPIEGFGSTTYDREDLQKGLEPDECYYIANAPAVIGSTQSSSFGSVISVTKLPLKTIL
jgi:Uma2 family endonuclease